MNNFLKIMKKGDKKVTNSELLGIIVCQLEAMMSKEQIERYNSIRKDMRENKL